jgi:UrcA family protein
MLKTTLIGACALSPILALNPASIAAQEPVVVEGKSTDDGYKQERISFADLNLTSEAGAKVLHERIKIASGRVCEGVDRWYGNGMPVSWGHCRHVTYEAVKPQVDAVIARARSGQAVATSVNVRMEKERTAAR